MKQASKLLQREVPLWLSGILAVGAGLTLLWFEKKRPLRRTRQEKVTRNARNFVISVITAGTIRASERPLAVRLMKEAEARNFGLLRIIRMPVWLQLLLSVVLLDYTLFMWHYLTHKRSLLWRFHEAHHVDLDLDASTALRFHPGEMFLSSAWRGSQVFILGISPLGLSVWQTLTLLAIMFHHSNVKLPIAVERTLSRLVVTPRMHGIHHSIVREEADSNWSTIFSWPDFVHGTLRLNVPQDAITIGIPAFQEPEELNLRLILELPFTPRRQTWRLPGDGTPERDRKNLPDSRAELLE